MKRSHLMGALSAALFGCISLASHAAAVSGQGTWESTLQGRDLDGNLSTFEAFYDTTLDITWMANANVANAGKSPGFFLDWFGANDWATGLNVNGVTGWRLPTNTPLNGSVNNYNTAFRNNGTSDNGTATTGTNGGWRDGGNPVSEMGHLFYVTLGNKGVYIPNGGGSSTSEQIQDGFGISNTANFKNIQSALYWSGSEVNSNDAWVFGFDFGDQTHIFQKEYLFTYAWAVHDGDVGVIPVPAAVWLFGSGLIGLLGMARRKR